MSIIFERTIVRKYLEKPVEKEKIDILMKAAMAAPSAKNAQPWEFIVVQNRETLLKITEFHPYSSMLKQAALAVIVCADLDKEIPDLKGMDYWVQDCAAATQNIMLQSTEMGLGSVWLGVFPREQIVKPLAKLFELPSNIVPFSIVSIGYPDGEVVPKNKFNADKVHYEKWEQ